MMRSVPSSAEANVRRAGYRKDVQIDETSLLADEPCVDLRAIGVERANH